MVFLQPRHPRVPPPLSAAIHQQSIMTALCLVTSPMSVQRSSVPVKNAMVPLKFQGCGHHIILSTVSPTTTKPIQNCAFFTMGRLLHRRLTTANTVPLDTLGRLLHRRLTTANTVPLDTLNLRICNHPMIPSTASTVMIWHSCIITNRPLVQLESLHLDGTWSRV